MVGVTFDGGRRPFETIAVCRFPRHSQERGTGVGDLLAVKVGGSGMSIRSSEAAIDEIVASCNGDLRGAVRALLLVNEHLEAELAQLYAAATHSSMTERRHSVLH
jgi:hypothetical protein